MNNNSTENSSSTPDGGKIFDEVWKEIEDAGKASAFPAKIFWLNGAPGAGKGTHTATIQNQLGFTAAPVVVSDLLNEPEARKLIDAGLLVGDREVLRLLLAKLREPQYAAGVIVDGFPRTATQVGFLRGFHARLSQWNLRAGKPAPQFSILVLYVDETESMNRQLKRGREAQAAGETVRKTDLDAELAIRRYRVFMEQTLSPLETLRGTFPCHFIESIGTIPEVAARVASALGGGQV